MSAQTRAATPATHLGRVLTSLFGRLGARYFVVFGVAEAAAAVVVAIGALGIVILYYPAPTGDAVRVAGVAVGAVTASLTWSFVRVRARAAPILAFMRGASGVRAEEAWCVAVRLPLDSVRVSFPGPLAVGTGTVVVYAAVELELPPHGVGVLLAAAAVALAYGMVLHFFAMELALRPAALAIAAELTRPPPEAGGTVSLKWRLLVALPILSVVTGAVAAGLAGGGGSETPGVVAAVVAGSIASLLVGGLLVASVLEPVADLREATERLRAGDVSARVAIPSASELARLGAGFNDAVEWLVERQALQQALSSYVHPHVAEQVLRGATEIDAKEVDATVMFVDIRGFTALAEHCSPEDLLSLVNRFVAAVVPALDAHGGHANKLIGDAVLGVFGAPEPCARHAPAAVAAAKDIVAALASEGVPVAIGINTGRVVAGTVGVPGRLDFTVMGDAVNVAARLQQLASRSGQAILISDTTRGALDVGHELQPAGTVRLRGRATPLHVHEVRASP